MAVGNPLLEARSLVTGFGATQVLHGVDLVVHEGEIAGIFGLNGAGKSVTIKALAGLVPLWSGSIVLDGVALDGVAAERRVGLGIGNVPQGRQVFPELTIEENLRLGGALGRKKDKAAWPGRLQRAYDLFPVLAEKRRALAGTLSGGQQASLAVARALVNEPRLLLIDEPSAGLAPLIVEELLEVLQTVAGTGVAMVLVEQNVAFGLRLAHTAHLMQTGRVILSGPVDTLDEMQLAEALGIGSVLAASTGRALGGRNPAAPPPKTPIVPHRRRGAVRQTAADGRRVPLRARAAADARPTP